MIFGARCPKRIPKRAQADRPSQGAAAWLCEGSDVGGATFASRRGESSTRTLFTRQGTALLGLQRATAIPTDQSMPTVRPADLLDNVPTRYPLPRPHPKAMIKAVIRSRALRESVIEHPSHGELEGSQPNRAEEPIKEDLNFAPSPPSPAHSTRMSLHRSC